LIAVMILNTIALSFCEVILLAYATQRLVFPYSTPILRILQLPTQ